MFFFDKGFVITKLQNFIGCQFGFVMWGELLREIKWLCAPMWLV